MSINPNFVEAVLRLHPGTRPLFDFVLQDNKDGKGLLLAEWYLPTPPPTDAEIAAVMAVAPVPASVTLLQARLALRQSGMLPQVNAAVAAASPDIQDMWQFSQALHRDNPNLLALASQLNLTSDALDNLFRLAATL